MRHIGYLATSNSTFKDFRYPLMLDGANHYVKTPGMGTAPVNLKAAKKQGAKLLLGYELEAETRGNVQKVWGK